MCLLQRCYILKVVNNIGDNKLYIDYFRVNNRFSNKQVLKLKAKNIMILKTT